MYPSGWAYVISNQDPRWTPKPIHTPIFTHPVRSWILSHLVRSWILYILVYIIYFIVYMYPYGGAYVLSNEDPRWTPKPIYSPIFTHPVRSWILAHLVRSWIPNIYIYIYYVPSYIDTAVVLLAHGLVMVMMMVGNAAVAATATAANTQNSGAHEYDRLLCWPVYCCCWDTTEQRTRPGDGHDDGW